MKFCHHLDPFVPPYFLVFDVESVGLQGEPFAVGYVVVATETGDEVESGIFVSSFESAVRGGTGRRQALVRDVEWCTAHVLPAIADVVAVDFGRRANIRKPFWERWKYWEERGAYLAADVPWPVEARFLHECVCWTFWPGPEIQSGPYPLIDIASVRMARGFDPLATLTRLENEEPAHNPLADARQSARLLLEALRA